MQNPDEDTEWNDILRSKGILPQKETEVTEADIVNMLEATIEEKQSKSAQQLERLSLDELDELEDEEDEKVILEYRKKRITQMKAEAAKARFGEVREISAEDYVEHVNNAGEGVWVVLHLFKQGIPLCSLLNQHLSQLSVKFPTTKFLKSVSTTCIPNFPDSNLPAIFIYFEGDLKKQLVGPHEFRGMNLTVDELEWILGQSGAVPTQLDEDPRPKVRDVLFSKLKHNDDDLSDDDDWQLK
ncbi:Viral IAP-associated factor-like protein [Cryptotermes secundus]|uniref:Viral IAP-associated factor-like protein n=1 Tax=Cryptotermes secundus TaxID=105785 RepID=A0A2J7R8K6_9NEOP|nr:viral IAP-associated factor homolog [Cryptotermes secundus]PNF37168.1 Viral IAP-associated factor-like protein [Cryptotermes secundus]